ncbi:type VII secretion protein EccB [Georgenia sp. Z1344]|uniref:type VII secretion protein EccB n=1 Tax=Georgenia sp. Z1344 TaxID=3416706 RepID=UPI003CEA91ED
MASNKDILDAQRFNRQRLVTSFVSGAPDGRELEPGKPWRGVVGGLVLVGLILAGGFVSRWLAPGTPEGWEAGSLVIIEEDGSRYVTSEGVMYPVLNTASARLVLGAGEMDVHTLSQEEVAGVTRGPTVGIPDAPDSLPEPGDLVNDEWLSCLAPSGASWTAVGRPTIDTDGTQVSAEPAEDRATVVRVEGVLWLVSGATRHEIDAEHEEAIVRALRLDSAPVVETSAAWLELFAPGTPLGPMSNPGAGDPMPEPIEGMPDVLAGQAVSMGEGDDVSYYILGAAGELQPLSAVGYEMYRLGDGEHLERDAMAVSAGDLGQMPSGDDADPADWPDEIAGPVVDDEGVAPCAQLVSDAMDASASSVLVAGHDVPEVGDDTVVVQGSSGALVSGSGGGLLTADFFIDETGRAYPLLGARGETLGMLGYELEDRATVPNPWVRLFPHGPGLQPLDLPALGAPDGESPSGTATTPEESSGDDTGSGGDTATGGTGGETATGGSGETASDGS